MRLWDCSLLWGPGSEKAQIEEEEREGLLTAREAGYGSLESSS